MKKLSILVALILYALIAVSCGPNDNDTLNAENEGAGTPINASEELDIEEHISKEETQDPANTDEDVKIDESESEAKEWDMEENRMVITIGENKFDVALEDNSSARALVDILKDGPIIYEADDYGGFEKVGEFGGSLPTNDTLISTVPGDVILYQGDKICIYYGTNEWNFTKLGHISDDENLKDRLGTGKVNVTLSLDR